MKTKIKKPEGKGYQEAINEKINNPEVIYRQAVINITYHKDEIDKVLIDSIDPKIMLVPRFNNDKKNSSNESNLYLNIVDMEKVKQYISDNISVSPLQASKQDVVDTILNMIQISINAITILLINHISMKSPECGNKILVLNKVDYTGYGLEHMDKIMELNKMIFDGGIITREEIASLIKMWY